MHHGGCFRHVIGYSLPIEFVKLPMLRGKEVLPG